MPIVIPSEPSFILQALAGFSAGIGDKLRQNKIIEGQQRIQFNQSLGKQFGDFAKGRLEQADRIEIENLRDKALLQRVEEEGRQRLDSDFVKRFGMTTDQVEQFRQERGFSTTGEAINRIEQINAARKQGFEEQFTQDQLNRQQELQQEALDFISNPLIDDAEKERNVNDIVNELNSMKKKFVFVGPQQPTAQDIFEKQTIVDQGGRRFQLEFRNGQPRLNMISGIDDKDLLKQAIDSLSNELDQDGNPVPFTQEALTQRIAVLRAALNPPPQPQQSIVPQPSPGDFAGQPAGPLIAPGAPVAIDQQSEAVAQALTSAGGEQLTPEMADRILRTQGEQLLSAAIQGDAGSAQQIAVLIQMLPADSAREASRTVLEELKATFGDAKAIPEETVIALKPLLRVIAARG